jgi:UDP-N-acetylmuramate--alanine ligase
MSSAPVDATPPAVDLTTPRRIHIVGIGGAGMSAIAIVLAESGHRVTGTDAAPSPVLDRLGDLGIATSVGHAAVHLPDDAELVSFSTAVPPDNPELAEARRRGLPVLARSTLLAAICAGREAVAVAGTHGKTTTSSVLAEVLDGCGRPCGFLVGARVASLGTSARAGTDPVFVVEADESDGTAFVLPRVGAVVTNVEPDHLEHHGGFAALRSGFDRFVADTPGPVVMCLDDPVAAALARAHRDHPRLVTYGTNPAADVRLVDLSLERSAVSWAIEHRGRRLDGARLALPGVHNALNATAAVALAVELGCDPTAAVAALGGHRGVARRFEPRGTARGVTFVDDYAHLPTEVAAAIAAARGGGWGRVVCVFQPHRYSRTEALWASFADAFAGADHLVLCGIYAAGEAPRPGVTGELLLHAVLEAHPDTDAVYCDTLDDVADHLDEVLVPGDLCLTLGAGDVTTVATTMVERWS